MWHHDGVALQRRQLAPLHGLGFPAAAGSQRVTAPDWSQVSDEQLAAELLRRATEQPLLLYQFGLPPRRMAFSSTLRGTCAVFGGTQSSKTVGVGVPWAASIAEGLHPRMACPETCPQFGVGSCGIHCCPCPERGSAAIPGCAAGNARECPVHPRFWWPEGDRLILVGCMSVSKWNEAIVPAFERYLSRFPDGTSQWSLRLADHAIEHLTGRYRIQAVMYDDPARNESTSPVAILDDEIPPFKVWQFQTYRAAVRNTQIKICGTTFDLLNKPDAAAWLFPKIIHKTSVAKARAQTFHLNTLDNVFLEPEARQRYAELGEQLLADGAEQEYQIRLCGIPSQRQDACFFNRATINRQGAGLLSPQRWYVVVDSAMSALPESPYFHGPTVWPQACELDGSARQALDARRAISGREGVACYDCPTPCAAMVSPPVRSRTVEFELPRLQRQKPTRGEWYAFDIFVPPQPGHRYAAGADNAKNVEGGDYSVLDIVDVHTGRQVAQFHGHAVPHMFAAIIFAAWSAYRFFLVPEENGFGTEIVQRLQELGMDVRDLFHRLDKSRKLPSGDPVSVVGWWTTRGTKQDPGGTLAAPYGDIPSPLGLYERLLRTGQLQLSSARSHAELGSFVQVAGRLAALSGAKDDTVISGALCALAYWIVRQNLERRPKLSAVTLDGADAIGALMPAAPPPPGEKWRDPEPPRKDRAPVWTPKGSRASVRRW